MSYSNGRRGLGAVQSTVQNPFTWSSLPKEGVRYDMEWATVGGARNDDIVVVIWKRLVELMAIDPNLTREQVWTNFGGDLLTPGFRLPEGGPLIQGLLSFWVRMSYAKELWPGWQCGDVPCFNFGPSNTNMTEVRINQGMWNLLWTTETRQPWRATDRGYVRVRLLDALYSYWIRNKLLAFGFINPYDITSVADDSAFVGGIIRFFNEARDAGLDVGPWAGHAASGGCPTHVFPDGSCYNFGPHHSDMFAPGEQIRLNPKLLDMLVYSTRRPSEVAGAAKAATGALARTRIKRPIFGNAVAAGKAAIFSPSAISLGPNLFYKFAPKG